MLRLPARPALDPAGVLLDVRLGLGEPLRVRRHAPLEEGQHLRVHGLLVVLERQDVVRLALPDDLPGEVLHCSAALDETGATPTERRPHAIALQAPLCYRWKRQRR